MLKLILLCVASLLSSGPAFATEPPAPIGKVLEIKGAAWRRHGENKSRLQPGDAITPGMELETSAASELVVRIGKDVVTMLKENSRASAESLQGSDTQLSLVLGSALSVVKNAAKRPDHFKVRTKAAVMGVRGTTFYVKVNSEKSTHLCTCNGTVSVSSPDGKSSKTITSQHHDAPQDISSGSSAIDSLMKPAPMVGHADPEAEHLHKLLGQ